MSTGYSVDVMASVSRPCVTSVDEVSSAGSLDLLEVMRPRIAAARELLLQRLQQTLYAASSVADPLPQNPMELIELLMPDLVSSLWRMSHRALVLEMHVARIGGELFGGTPSARYASFLQRLTKPQVQRQFFEEYVVLERLTATECQQWVDRSLQLANRLSDDWCEIKSWQPGVYSPPTEYTATKLTAVEATGGDRHAGGRSVSILEFSSGLRVVYKPRSLAAEETLQKLIAWTNVRGIEFTNRTLRMLSRETYGWVEYVQHAACTTTTAVGRYYRRQGGLLAMLYLLGATDMHYENILACGEFPVLLDTEALFHRRLPDVGGDVVGQGFSASVAAIRLLPQAALVPGSDEPIDLSGLGACAGQATPFRAHAWQAIATDEMRCSDENAHVEELQNLPVYAGQPQSPQQYTDDLKRGFVDVYRLLIRYRFELQYDSAIWPALTTLKTRFIPRPSQAYAILQEQSYHPDALRSEAAFAACFERLSTRARQFPSLARLQAAEQAALSLGDIPYFTTMPDAGDLWSCQGERIPDFFNHSALTAASKRLQSLGDADLARQLWLIDASMASRFTASPTNFEVRCSQVPDHSENCMQRSRRITRQLERLSWQDVRQAGWLTLVPLKSIFSIGPLSLGVSHGLAGVVAALVRASQYDSSPSLVQLLPKATRSLCDLLAEALLTANRETAEPLPELAETRLILLYVANRLPTAELASRLKELAQAMERVCSPRDLAALSAIEQELCKSDASESLPRFERWLRSLAEVADRTAPGVRIPDLCGGLAGELLRLLPVSPEGSEGD